MLDTSYSLTTELVVRKFINDPDTLGLFYTYRLLPLSSYGSPALQEIITLTINSGSTSLVDGEVSITLPGLDTIVFDALSLDTPEIIGARIAASTSFTGWTVINGATDNIVLFTKKVAGYLSGLPSFIDIPSIDENTGEEIFSGVTGSIVITRSGANAVNSTETEVLTTETKQMLYALANLLIANDAYIVDNDIENLIEEDFLISEFRELFQRSNIPARARQYIFYDYKYSAVSYFFQKNYSYFLPSSELEEIDSREKLRLFLKSFLREFDKFSDVIARIYEVNDIDKVDEQYLIYIAQLLGHKKEDERVSTNISFRHFIKNIVEIYKIKGTNYAFELYLNFLGFTATIYEFWFDRRYYYSSSSKNQWTDSSDKEDYGWYLTPIKPSEGIPINLINFVPETVTQEDVTYIRNLYEFNRLANTAPQTIPVANLLGYINDPNVYSGDTFTYFKTNYMIYEVAKINEEGTIEQISAEELDLLTEYLDMFTPIFIMKNIYLKSIPFDQFIDLDIFEEKLLQLTAFPSFDYLGSSLPATREISDTLLAGTDTTTMVFTNTKYFSIGQEIYVYVGSTDVLRGKTRIASGSGYTWTVSPLVDGMTADDTIQVRDKNILSSNLSLDEAIQDYFDYGVDYTLGTLLSFETDQLNRIYDYNTPQSFMTAFGLPLENIIDSGIPVIAEAIYNRGWKYSNTTIGDVYNANTSALFRSLIETKVTIPPNFHEAAIDTDQHKQTASISGYLVNNFGPLETVQTKQTIGIGAYIVSNFGGVDLNQAKQDLTINLPYNEALLLTQEALGTDVVPTEIVYSETSKKITLADAEVIIEEILGYGNVYLDQKKQTIVLSGNIV